MRKLHYTVPLNKWIYFIINYGIREILENKFAWELWSLTLCVISFEQKQQEGISSNNLSFKWEWQDSVLDRPREIEELHKGVKHP